ncbi:hypothetical protein LZF95_16560 [Algoriphagus sp. AGSA1]|uniref:hypothetical protein n=1 Tax=unclassified Algoriphagus TaxID=2641541 RepID=UPI00177F6D04|nr:MULTISPECIES: hypothetical protein [unclassified Algoriphagus]MCE7056296.1 hypothetical protein [Algoriphagus sp. AGSA1]
MGKLVKCLVLAICITACGGMLFRFFNGGYNSAMYRIFQTSTRGYFFHKFLGITPSEIYDDYTISVLDSSGDSELINIVDNKSSTKTNFVVLRQNSQESFIKAYPWSLFGDNSEKVTDKNNYLSKLINLDSFNLYVRLFNVDGEKSIVNKYCYFISNPNNFDDYVIIQDLTDLEVVVLNNPIDKKETLIGLGFDIIDLSTLIIEDSDGIVYCWYQNHGLVKFHFMFDNGSLVDVKSENLGYLGNEFPSCC